MTYEEKVKNLGLGQVHLPGKDVVDLLGAIKYFMSEVYKRGLEKSDGSGAHMAKTRNFSQLIDELDLGVQKATGNFLLVVRNLGLAEHRGGGRNSAWEVADPAVVEACTQEDLQTALDELLEEKERQRAAMKQRKKTERAAAKKAEAENVPLTPGEQLNSNRAKESPVITASTVKPRDELLLEATDLAEQLQEQLRVARARIAELEAELAATPNIDDSVAARLAKIKQGMK